MVQNRGVDVAASITIPAGFDLSVRSHAVFADVSSVVGEEKYISPATGY